MAVIRSASAASKLGRPGSGDAARAAAMQMLVNGTTAKPQRPASRGATPRTPPSRTASQARAPSCPASPSAGRRPPTVESEKPPSRGVTCMGKVGYQSDSAASAVSSATPAQAGQVIQLGDARVQFLLDMLPQDVREKIKNWPSELRDHAIAQAVSALIQSGTGEAMNSINSIKHSAAPAKEAAGAACEWHGLRGDPTWSLPKAVAESSEAARPGYMSRDASEYMDAPQVLKAKAKLLAAMWKRSARNTVLYTGAGLSTASGIGDYASKASKSVAPHKKQVSGGSRLDLEPTAAHHALAAIGEKGLIGNWVQQNHDRLAQKAGFPQARLNEIHGAWGDNKNSVKMMDDQLRKDLLEWLEAWAERASMCVALGTSLCGMNADQVPRGVAERFTCGEGEGLVIIGLQKTVYDDVASLRIWGLCDEVMQAVASELGCKAPNPKVVQRGDEWRAKHPQCKYNTPTRSFKDPL
eukprot:TRINITY_DN112073_c0_g1_i1.p1 TRINITY_DN112073_c0_g1~~TRINITY_DN112073_c0_g1_i1.p1  ORF type:complete len:495 (-),score=67.40 TRINITY_DN112073_c0_g1_i1:195-1598(-)